jgi:hypothetical protein
MHIRESGFFLFTNAPAAHSGNPRQPLYPTSIFPGVKMSRKLTSTRLLRRFGGLWAECLPILALSLWRETLKQSCFEGDCQSRSATPVVTCIGDDAFLSLSDRCRSALWEIFGSAGETGKGGRSKEHTVDSVGQLPTFAPR